jgi:hypothetical protein
VVQASKKDVAQWTFFPLSIQVAWPPLLGEASEKLHINENLRNLAPLPQEGEENFAQWTKSKDIVANSPISVIHENLHNE